jgi:hypothetical protein
LEIFNITSWNACFHLRISLAICSMWWPLQNNTGQKSDKYNFPSKNNPCFLTTLNYVNTCLVKKECDCNHVFSVVQYRRSTNIPFQFYYLYKTNSSSAWQIFCLQQWQHQIWEIMGLLILPC